MSLSSWGVADAVLAYYPDGTLQISPRWTSASTNEMITEITGMETWTERGVWLRPAADAYKLSETLNVCLNV